MRTGSEPHSQGTWVADRSESGQVGAGGVSGRAGIDSLARGEPLGTDRIHPRQKPDERSTNFVGDDWADDHPDVQLMDDAGERLSSRLLPEGLAGIGALHKAGSGPPRKAGRVALPPSGATPRRRELRRR
jgi:hypothetical protein